MRILLAHPSTELYGSDRQLLESVDSFTAAGADVTVVLPGAGDLAARLTGVDIRTARFPVLRKAQLRPHRLLLLLLATPLAVLRLARLIRDARPDVVYVNTVTMPHWVLAARLARRPVLVHVHEAEELSSPLVRRVLYAPLLAAHRVVANSATTSRVVTTAWRAIRNRVVVVPNGVPDPGAQRADATVAGRLVLVSRLSPRKGIDVALEAVASLRTAGRDVSLTICGSTFPGYEWFEQSLRERAARPDLAGRVTFAGFVDPVQDELAAAEVVLVPSLGESFGNAAVEALLARRATVASDVQGLAEIIDDGDTGLLVPAGDATALAGAVARLLDDPALRADVARRGRDDAAARFSTARYGSDLVAVARDLANDANDDNDDTDDTDDESSSTGAPVTTTLAALALVAVTAAACTSSDSSAQSSEASSPPPSNVISGSATPTAAPPATSTTTAPSSGAVPAPGSSGNINETVAPRSVTTRPAVALDKTAAFGDGVQLRLVDHTRITGKATRPGEVSGPAIRLTLSLTNSSGRAIALDDAVVAVTDSRRVPLSSLADSTTPWHGRLAAGRTATGRYVFVLSMGRHNPYTISVSHSGQSAVVQLVGDAA